MERRVYLTEDGVRKCKAGAKEIGETVVFTDDRLKGFLLKVSPDGETATFYVQRDVGGKAVRVALGRHGTGKTASEFRTLAEEVRGELGKANKATDPAEAARIIADVRARMEEDGGAPRRRGKWDEAAAQAEVPAATGRASAPDEWERFTVAQAMEEHFANMRAKKRARSVGRAEEDTRRYLGEWMERPIAGIRRKECIDLHRRVSEDHGATVANKAFRLLRAYWYSAAARFEVDDRFVNPVRKMTWNDEEKGKPIDWEALPDWATQVNGLGNPVRRDWYWFVLLTALRNEDARTLRWEEVNLTDKAGWYVNAQGERIPLPARSMHRPCPKGGERKAFTVPLSAQAVDILKRRRAENVELFGDDRGWVFPTRTREGGEVVHLREAKEQDYKRDAAGKVAKFSRNAAGEWVPDPKGQPRKFTSLPNPHRLRHTFASTADEAEVGVSERVMKALMNHTPDATNMNHRYNRPSMDAMRSAAEKVSAFLIRKAGTAPSISNPAGRIAQEDTKAKRATA